MKRLLILPLIFCLLFIVGCQKDFEEKPVKKFTRCEAPHQQENVGDRQWYMNGFTPITACEASSINVFIDPCLHDTPYATAIPTGLQAYNDAPISINFTLVKNPANADLTFFCWDGDDLGEDDINCCGCANAAFPDPGNTGDTAPNDQTFFPSGGSIGSEIALVVNWWDCPCDAAELTECLFASTVMHEIAHTLGFYHNDQVGVDPVHVDGTPMGYESNSIINAYLDCESPCIFSEDDLEALQLLYPLPELDGPDKLCVGETASFCLINNDATISDIEWQGNSQFFITAIHCASTALNSTGIQKVEATVTIEDCEFYVSKDVLVCASSEVPSIPPVELSDVCFGETVCYDLGTASCIDGLTAISSSSKLLTNVKGTKLCLGYIAPLNGSATVTVTPLGCNAGPSQTWDINLSACNGNGTLPTGLGGGVTINPSGNNGGINAVDPATDCVTNNCPCHVDAECPPGFRCIGGKWGPKRCVPF